MHVKTKIMSVNWGNFTLLIYCPALARIRRKRKQTSSEGYYEQYIKLIMNIYKNLITAQRVFLKGQEEKPLIRTFPLNHANALISLQLPTRVLLPLFHFVSWTLCHYWITSHWVKRTDYRLNQSLLHHFNLAAFAI